jgi:hypothetical protein
VSAYISQRKENYPVLREIILVVQMNINELKVEKIAALTYAACIVGGAPWIGLPSMLKNMEDHIRSSVLQ